MNITGGPVLTYYGRGARFLSRGGCIYVHSRPATPAALNVTQRSLHRLDDRPREF